MPPNPKVAITPLCLAASILHFDFLAVSVDIDFVLAKIWKVMRLSYPHQI